MSAGRPHSQPSLTSQVHIGTSPGPVDMLSPSPLIVSLDGAGGREVGRVARWASSSPWSPGKLRTSHLMADFREIRSGRICVFASSATPCVVIGFNEHRPMQMRSEGQFISGRPATLHGVGLWSEYNPTLPKPPHLMPLMQRAKA